MTQSELIADQIQRSFGMLTMTLADFSDAEILMRPVPGANNVAWQLGHLVAAETMMLSAMKPGAAPELPAGFADKFNKETAHNDDAGFFPSKATLLESLGKVNAASVAFAKSCTPADLNKPGPERMARMAPTVGHVLGLLGNHYMMHMGQIQVLRRKLGKPVLF